LAENWSGKNGITHTTTTTTMTPFSITLKISIN
jgi:hypothetical protein